MKRVLLFAAAIVALAPLCANAASSHLTDRDYIAAKRCLAYADIQELQSDAANFAALASAVHTGFRSSDTIVAGRDAVDRVHTRGRFLANTNNLRQLREERDAACANFVQQGLVQLAPSTSAG